LLSVYYKDYGPYLCESKAEFKVASKESSISESIAFKEFLRFSLDGNGQSSILKHAGTPKIGQRVDSTHSSPMFPQRISFTPSNSMIGGELKQTATIIAVSHPDKDYSLRLLQAYLDMFRQAVEGKSNERFNLEIVQTPSVYCFGKRF